MQHLHTRSFTEKVKEFHKEGGPKNRSDIWEHMGKANNYRSVLPSVVKLGEYSITKV